jgi:CheY-like chemotaxis protein
MFCTANADPKTVERALAVGAVDFVKKPIVVDASPGASERAPQARAGAVGSWAR